MPNVGEPAPEFTALTDTGTTISLSDFKGKQNVVLYFYPKDDTPGCTKEACGFRDAQDDLIAQQAAVLGVSRDSEAKHQKFKEKYDLNFTLLVDAEAEICTAYDAFGEKKNYGRTYMGIFRKTYLIDKHGIIAKVWPKVKPADHAQEVLQALRELDA